MLRDYREGLRLTVDPDTGQDFTEDTIRRVTARGSSFYRRSDALDIVLLGVQKKDEFFAQQVRIDRAASAFLYGYHGRLWGEEPLPAFGGSGKVAATGNAGTIWAGSTSVPDPFAVRATDPAGLRYQVVVGGEADGSGEAELTLVAIDGGSETNLAEGTELTWTNPPPGSAPTATVTGAAFTGGLPEETDADFAARLAARVRHKPASGNWSHLRTFARDATVSVEDAFVYPCAFHAGSVLVAVTGKRGNSIGPLGRIPAAGVLGTVTAALVPPGSPDVAGRAHVLVVPPTGEPSDLVLQLDQPFGSPAGWTDTTPFPPVGAGGAAIEITTLTTQQNFRVTTAAAGQLPGGATGPLAGVSLMVWDDASSAFETLTVDTVEDLGAGVYRVILAAAAAKTLALGDVISPHTQRAATLAAGVEAYFDSLGPGEVIDLDGDERGSRAYRNPIPAEEFPSRAGQAVVSFVTDALGSVVADASLASLAPNAPSVPSDPVLGPMMLVLGKLGVYPATV